MKPRTSAILVVLAIISLAAGWYFGVATIAPEQTNAAAGTLVFPGLTQKLQAAAKVEVKHAGTTLVIDREGDHWGLPADGGYPVEPTKMSSLLTALTELRVTEARTSDPANYARLGVEDPNDPAATSNLLRVVDKDGKPIAELIVGHRRVRTQADVPETVYIRRPGEKQSWLAQGSLEVDADPQLWIARDIMSIDEKQIATIDVTRGDQTLAFKREGDKIVLTAPADHPKLDDYKLDDIGRALDALTLTDVKPAAQEPGAKLGTGVFTTTNGMKVTATVYKLGDGDKAQIWSQFDVAGDGAAKDAAAKLEAHVHGWAYQLGSWKEAALVPTMDEIKSTDTAAASPASPAAPAAAGASMATPTVLAVPAAPTAAAAPKQ